MAVGSGHVWMPIADNTEMAAVREHRPRPDRSLITATFFVIVIKKSSFPNIFTNMY